jgi:hypothetical protein
MLSFDAELGFKSIGLNEQGNTVKKKFYKCDNILFHFR